jgi:hypothetical protein
MDWLEAFEQHPDLTVTDLNIFKTHPKSHTDKLINDADLLILLHSCTADSLNYITPFIHALQDRKGKLVSFVGNELNMPHVKMSDRIQFLKEIHPDYIATQMLLELGEWLYESTGSTVITVPHALNLSSFKSEINYNKRPITFGVRSFRYPSYIGDNDRNRIMDYFNALDVSKDISFNDRLDREQWATFLSKCRATMTTEAGSWYVERDDKTVTEIYNFITTASDKFVIKRTPLMSKLLNSLPYRFKQSIKGAMKNLPVVDQASVADDADFDEIFELFFKGKSKCPAYGKAISSRHFDAIGTKTIQVSFPGRYNDILRADEHYISLNTDFSNIDEVLAKVADVDFCETMTERTLDYALAGHTHRHRIDDLIKTVTGL